MFNDNYYFPSPPVNKIVRQCVSDGFKTVEICRFENHLPHKFDGSSIRHRLVACLSESWSVLAGLERSWHPLEQGRNAGAHFGRTSPQEHGKTVVFKPATFRGFRNGAAINALEKIIVAAHGRLRAHRPPDAERELFVRRGISAALARSRPGANSQSCGGISRGPKTSSPCAAFTATVASGSFANTSILTPPETTHFAGPPEG